MTAQQRRGLLTFLIGLWFATAGLSMLWPWPQLDWIAGCATGCLLTFWVMVRHSGDPS